MRSLRITAREQPLLSCGGDDFGGDDRDQGNLRLAAQVGGGLGPRKVSENQEAKR